MPHVHESDWQEFLLWKNRETEPPMNTTASAIIAEGREMAARFHEAYERLAPQFGYETRADTKAFDPHSPNGRLMAAVCAEILATPPEPQGDEVARLREAARRLVAKLDMTQDCKDGRCGVPNFGDELDGLRQALESSQ